MSSSPTPTEELRALVRAEMERSLHATSAAWETPRSDLEALRRCVADGADVCTTFDTSDRRRLGIVEVVLQSASPPFVLECLEASRRIIFTNYIRGVCHRESCTEAAVVLDMVLRRLRTRKHSDVMHWGAVMVRQCRTDMLSLAASTGMLGALWPVLKRHYPDPSALLDHPPPFHLTAGGLLHDWESISADERHHYFVLPSPSIQRCSRSSALLLRGTLCGEVWRSVALVQRCARDDVDLSIRIPRGGRETLLHGLLRRAPAACVWAALETTTPMDFSLKTRSGRTPLHGILERRGPHAVAVVKAVADRLHRCPSDIVDWSLKDLQEELGVLQFRF